MALVLRKLLETSCHSFMRVTETFFEAQYLLAHHAKAKVPRFNRTCMDRANRDLVHAIAGHGDEWVRSGNEGKFLLLVHIFPQREYLLWPASMSQPTALVSWVGSDTEQIIDRALHAPRSRKQTPKIRIRQVGRFRGMFYDQHFIGCKISGVHMEATVAAAIVRSPQRHQLRPRLMEPLRGGEPFVTVYTLQGRRQICRQQERVFLRYLRAHMDYPIS